MSASSQGHVSAFVHAPASLTAASGWADVKENSVGTRQWVIDTPGRAGFLLGTSQGPLYEDVFWGLFA